MLIRLHISNIGCTFAVPNQTSNNYDTSAKKLHRIIDQEIVQGHKKG